VITRKEFRERTAKYLNSLSRDELFERFEITRVANITGYDILGIPVYSSCRPASKTISVSAGKSMNPEMARAGAVAEGIEFYTFENPVGWSDTQPYKAALELPTIRDSKWTPETPISITNVRHFASGNWAFLPSEMVWLRDREHFLCSSNGQALGGSFDDAFLQGVYEVVERDQITLRRISMENLRVFPPRVEIPQSMSDLYGRICAARLKLYLLYCSSDISIPVYVAILTDPFGGVGAFSGCGAHLNQSTAAERAILEAVQCRAVYIAGARDDILRRDFRKLKERDPNDFANECEALTVHPFPFDTFFEMSVQDELMVVLYKLSRWKNGIYYKHLDLGGIHAVKTVILGMECPKFTGEDAWRSIRYSTLAQAYINAAQDQGMENFGAVQQLKEISFETLSI
jgi:ribosomal protein S12 methylthiotransferase accessory factor